MANTQAICNSFKTELMTGTHDLSGADVLKAALYLTSATINKSATVYTVTGEITGTNYTAAGETITNATAPALDTDTAHWTPSASLAWTNLTQANFNCVLFYNSTKTNKAIASFVFGDQSVTAGNFTLNMPTNDGTTGLIRLL